MKRFILASLLLSQIAQAAPLSILPLGGIEPEAISPGTSLTSLPKETWIEIDRPLSLDLHQRFQSSRRDNDIDCIGSVAPELEQSIPAGTYILIQSEKSRPHTLRLGFSRAERVIERLGAISFLHELRSSGDDDSHTGTFISALQSRIEKIEDFAFYCYFGYRSDRRGEDVASITTGMLEGELPIRFRTWR